MSDSSISLRNLVCPVYSRQVRDRFISSHNIVCPVNCWQIRDFWSISPHNLVCPVYSWQIRDRFFYFSPQLSMKCIFLSDTWQIHLFLPTNFMPWIFISDTWKIHLLPHKLVCHMHYWQIRDSHLFLPTNLFARFIPCRYVTDSFFSPHNSLCPVYSLQMPEIFISFSPHLSMPCLFLADTW